MPKKSPVSAELMAYVKTAQQNLNRVNGLVQIYDDLTKNTKGRRSVLKSDILRSSVVLLHASLEELLREIARAYLPRAGEAELNDIPLKGLSPSGRPEKFFLGKLAQFRGAMVDDVITLSVAAYLERSNYNNANEIAALLDSLGLDTSLVKPLFPQLNEIMARRHAIVHKADRPQSTGKGRHHASSITAAQVRSWVNAAFHFMAQVILALDKMDERTKENAG
jgi:hypothetical protein